MQAAPVRPRVEKPDRKPWIDEELAGTRLRDARLDKRLRKVLGLLSDGMGQSLPRACQDWANTKAADRFFANDRVTEAEILRGHFESTAQRAGSVAGPLLVLHDTTEFSYKRAAPCALGLLHRRPQRQYGSSLPKERTQKGILMHSSLVVLRKGLPLGLAAIKFWTRAKFKGANALKRTINPTRIPIAQKESIKWQDNLRQATALLDRPVECVHIGDRESDIFELFCLAEEVQTKFLLRTCVDRLAQDGQTTVADVLRRAKVRGLHRVELRNKQGQAEQAELALKFEQLVVRPPIGKQRQYPELTLTVIHAREANKPRHRERIEWKLVTNLPVETLAAAVEKLDWYALRWRIEMFHKVLKSGCRAEEAKLHATPDGYPNRIRTGQRNCG